jgi:hypothetical protein
MENARPKPASPRTAALPPISQIQDLSDYLGSRFREAGSYECVLTPSELCDIVEHYAEQVSVRWTVETDGRMDSKSDVLVKLGWKSDEKAVGPTLVGLYTFSSAQRAQNVWFDYRGGLFEKPFPVQRVLDIRGAHALNFQGGSYSYTSRDLVAVEPNDLWRRLLEHAAKAGIPLAAAAAKIEIAATPRQRAALSFTPAFSQKKWGQFWR